jgi:phage tail sheath protein FI
MALFTPSESPAIVVKELDLSGVVPNVTTSTGAFVGDFKWGPINTPLLISNEAGLVEAYGSPDSDNTVEWHSAAYFLRYSNSLRCVRAENNTGDLPVNAYDVTAAVGSIADSASYPIPSASRPLIKSQDNWDNQKATLASSTFVQGSSTVTVTHTFLSKWAGDIGSSLSVQWIGADSAASTTGFDAWTYRTSFDAAPKTSTYASDRGASNDEIHVVVLDEDGLFTGTRGSVLETFPYVSVAKNAVNADGSTNYAPDVISNASEYIWMASFGPGTTAKGRKFSALAGTPAVSGTNYVYTSGGDVVHTASLINGRDVVGLDAGDYATGFDQFNDPETIQVDMLIAPGMSNRSDQTTVVNDLVTIAQTTRKDCVAVTSPARSDIINNATQVTDTITTAATFTSSSYLIVDNNYLKVYDKYNDQYIHIPAASSTAGLMANTDFVAAPWFSPAGPRRGQYLGITALSYSPEKSERDQLYRAGVNPIANIPGQGVLLFGDKTKLARPSAFDRINVRRLFLGIERAIAIAARNVMFEFNDEFTRAEFKNVIEPFLREIQGRRGITDFKVVCDDTNNTAAVIDRNEFICSIFIKPARSINYVTLNFVAVRTGVDFEEVVGTV